MIIVIEESNLDKIMKWSKQLLNQYSSLNGVRFNNSLNSAIYEQKDVDSGCKRRVSVIDRLPT
jgi:hypothetical protein